MERDQADVTKKLQQEGFVSHGDSRRRQTLLQKCRSGGINVFCDVSGLPGLDQYSKYENQEQWSLSASLLSSAFTPCC